MIWGKLSTKEQIGVYGALSASLAMVGLMTLGFFVLVYGYAVKPLVMLADSLIGTGYRPVAPRYQGSGISSFGSMVVDCFLFAAMLFPIALVVVKLTSARWAHALIFFLWYLAIFGVAVKLGTLSWIFPLQ